MALAEPHRALNLYIEIYLYFYVCSVCIYICILHTYRVRKLSRSFTRAYSAIVGDPFWDNLAAFQHRAVL